MDLGKEVEHYEKGQLAKSKHNMKFSAYKVDFYKEFGKRL